MSKTVFFIYKTFVVGGAELLIQKMAGTIASFGIDTCLICHNIDEGHKNKLLEAGINVKSVADWADKQAFRAILNESDEAECVTFSYNDYVMIKSIRHRHKKTVFYAIHYMALTVDPDKKLFLLQKTIMKQVVKAALRSNSLLCMDEQTVRFTQKFYQEEPFLQLLYERIIRISVKIPDADLQVRAQRKKDQNIHILSIARADFPFKGYLTGLVDSFREDWIQERFLLDIVSYGDGVALLQQHIDALPEEVQSKIHLHGKMDYADLEPLFEKAGLYIGMGTTVLDAACRGIPAIAVKAYTHNICCDHFFHENYRDVAIDNGSYIKYLELIRRIADMPCEEYLEISQHSQALIKEHYDVRSTSTALLCHFKNMVRDEADGVVWISECIRSVKWKLKLLFK